MKRHPYEIAPALKDAFLFSVVLAYRILLSRGNALARRTWGLDLRSLWLLIAVSDRQLNQKELAVAFCMRPDDMGKLINKLERGKYVQRTVNLDDKRMKLVQITRKGEAVIKQRERLRDDAISKLLHPLTAAVGLSMQMVANKIIDSAVEGPTK